MNQLANLNYTFEELEILKILVKFSHNPAKAEDMLKSGLSEYEMGRMKKIVTKLFNDGIWEYVEAQESNDHPLLKLNLGDFILKYPNPIPEKIRSEIDTTALLEKLPCSNLNLSEIRYITTLLKKDAIHQF